MAEAKIYDGEGEQMGRRFLRRRGAGPSADELRAAELRVPNLKIERLAPQAPLGATHQPRAAGGGE